MNKIIPIILISFSATIFSQVRIGKSNASNLSSNSVLLEFGDTKDKGIVLPYIENIPSEGSAQATGGTIIFDVSANTEYKIKVKNQNAGWRDLSVQSGYSTSVETIVKPAQAAPLTDNAIAKAIIGSATSTADGILVLESVDKAMVLPIVDDYKAIKNPSPGMLAFLKGLTADEHRLIVFNGQKWTFWAPKIN